VFNRLETERAEQLATDSIHQAEHSLGTPPAAPPQPPPYQSRSTWLTTRRTSPATDGECHTIMPMRVKYEASRTDASPRTATTPPDSVNHHLASGGCRDADGRGADQRIGGVAG
jgi:hypothetical protein